MTKLYHKEVFWPKNNLDLIHGQIIPLTFSKHAQDSCLNDRYGQIHPPKEICFDKDSVFEIEITDKLITKIVIRVAHDYTDLIIVMIPEFTKISKQFFVKTLWRNQKTDNHATLNAGRYATA